VSNTKQCAARGCESRSELCFLHATAARDAAEQAAREAQDALEAGRRRLRASWIGATIAGDYTAADTLERAWRDVFGNESIDPAPGREGATT